MTIHPYETQALIQLHRCELLSEAERERALARAPGRPFPPMRRALARAGAWLVRIGTRLERRYADAPRPAPFAVAPQGEA